jgi:hypothetical protein
MVEASIHPIPARAVGVLPMKDVPVAATAGRVHGEGSAERQKQTVCRNQFLKSRKIRATDTAPIIGFATLKVYTGIAVLQLTKNLPPRRSDASVTVRRTKKQICLKHRPSSPTRRVDGHKYRLKKSQKLTSSISSAIVASGPVFGRLPIEPKQLSVTKSLQPIIPRIGRGRKLAGPIAWRDVAG